MLAAIDALGDACKDDEDITKRLQEEMRVPPAVGPWHRDTHTFVTVAKRSPERVEQFMNAFTTHPVFWVRMYSVHAVVAAKDVAQLEKLALDSRRQRPRSRAGAAPRAEEGKDRPCPDRRSWAQ